MIIKFSLLLFISFILILTFKLNSGFPESMNHGNFFPYIIDRPFTEDGFYMMTAAWNIAEGNGIKYNLGRPTTGIQPLSTFVQAGIAKIVMILEGDKIVFLRVMILFSTLLLLIFSFAAGGIIKKIIPPYYSPIIMVFLVLFCLELFDYFNNGLETGIYLIMITLCINFSFKFIKNHDYKSAFIFGILTGITALTRVDFVIPLFAYLIILLFHKKISFQRIFIVLAITILFLSPWLIYVYNVSGSIFPSSVSSQTYFVTNISIIDRFYFIIRALLHHLTPFVYTHNIFISSAIAILMGFIFFNAAKRKKLSELVNINSGNLLMWGISFLLLSFSYFIYSSATYFYIRYTTPFYLVIFLFTSCIFFLILNKTSFRIQRLVIISLLFLFFIQVFYYQFNGKLSDHLTLRIAYIDKNFNEPGIIGMFQSGVSGFFLENVINLDGKMDNAVSEYGRDNRFHDFLDSMNVNVIIEWEKDFNVNINKTYFKNTWEMIEKDIGDGTTSCFVRIKSDLQILRVKESF
jgi:hypothetical protein